MSYWHRGWKRENSARHHYDRMKHFGVLELTEVKGGRGIPALPKLGRREWREVEAVTNTRAGSSRRCCTRAERRSRERSWGGVWVYRVARTLVHTPDTETPYADCPHDKDTRAFGSCTYSWMSASRVPSRRVCSGTCPLPRRMRSGRDSIREWTFPATAPCCSSCCWSRPAAFGRVYSTHPSETGRPDRLTSRRIKANGPMNCRCGRNLSAVRELFCRPSLQKRKGKEKEKNIMSTTSMH